MLLTFKVCKDYFKEWASQLLADARLICASLEARVILLVLELSIPIKYRLQFIGLEAPLYVILIFNN